MIVPSLACGYITVVCGQAEVLTELLHSSGRSRHAGDGDGTGAAGVKACVEVAVGPFAMLHKFMPIFNLMKPFSPVLQMKWNHLLKLLMLLTINEDGVLYGWRVGCSFAPKLEPQLLRTYINSKEFVRPTNPSISQSRQSPSNLTVMPNAAAPVAT